MQHPFVQWVAGKISDIGPCLYCGSTQWTPLFQKIGPVLFAETTDDGSQISKMGEFGPSACLRCAGCNHLALIRVPEGSYDVTGIKAKQLEVVLSSVDTGHTDIQIKLPNAKKSGVIIAIPKDQIASAAAFLYPTGRVKLLVTDIHGESHPGDLIVEDVYA